MIYGWDKMLFYVNSAAHIGRARLDDLGWPVDEGGAVAEGTLRQFLNVSSGTNPVIGTFGLRRYVQDHYRPRGEPLSKSAANELLAGRILPRARVTNGVVWIEESELKRVLAARPAQVSSVRSVAGASPPSQGSAPRGRRPGRAT
jgi:hypothetical protein